jgi:hypothetical protein
MNQRPDVDLQTDDAMFESDNEMLRAVGTGVVAFSGALMCLVAACIAIFNMVELTSFELLRAQVLTLGAAATGLGIMAVTFEVADGP